MSAWLRWLAMALFVALAVSCAPDLSESTAVLLVPADETYRSQWQFEPVDGADNFHVFVHWSASFNPDVDRSLTLVAYQVSDVDEWRGADAETEQTADALRAHAAGGCNDVVEAELDVLSCAYDLGPAEQLVITSRAFDTSTGPAIILVPGDDVSRAVRYLVGDFDEFAPSQAAAFVR